MNFHKNCIFISDRRRKKIVPCFDLKRLLSGFTWLETKRKECILHLSRFLIEMEGG